MNTERIRTIIEKEWAEVFKNRLVLFTIGFMPLIFTLLPLGILYSTRGSLAETGGSAADLPPQFAQLCASLPEAECMQVFILNQFLILFMVMPLIIPVSIAAYSIVGEKTTRSLEPLLATPISTGELLLGKCLAAVIPAVLAVNFAIMVSSRVTDPRVAEQTSAVIIVPLLAVLFGQIAGLVVINLTFMLAAIAILVLIDAGVTILGVRLFQRETILTKWK